MDTLRSCGGKLQHISNESPQFLSCSAINDISCESAFESDFQGNTSWIVEDGKNAWVEIVFKKDYQLKSVEIRPKLLMTNNIEILVLIFNDQTTQEYELKKIETT